MLKHWVMAAMACAALFVVACGGASNAPVANTGDAKKETEAPKDARLLSFSGENSKVAWVGRKMTGKHEGGFKTFSGKAWLSADGRKLEKVEVEIEMNSVFSDSDMLTGHLKKDDFFNVEKYPRAKFVSTEIKAGDGEGATFVGNLSLRDVTKSITFPATVKISDGKLSATAEFQFNRMDFGVKYPGKQDDLINEMVDLKLTIEAK